MPSIPNPEPAHAAAHSPNPGDRIQDEGDSDNRPPIEECFLVKLIWTLHEKICLIKQF